MIEKLHNILSKSDLTGETKLLRVPEGYGSCLLAQMAQLYFNSAQMEQKIWLHICRNDASLQTALEGLAVFAPEIDHITFPAWDCLPYDRTSPSPSILSKRLSALHKLALHKTNPTQPLIVFSTINALVQKTLTPEKIAELVIQMRPGEVVDIDKLLNTLTENGYMRLSTVTEPGEFAQRGGLIDIFPPGEKTPFRLDFFGQSLESIRRFDPSTQITTGQCDSLTILPASEIQLTEESIARFRRQYASQFGSTIGQSDPLYETISSGQKFSSMEHWLPLFHENLGTFFDYVKGAVISTEHLAVDALDERLTLIEDFYLARKADLDTIENGNTAFSSAPYKALPQDMLYLSGDAFQHQLSSHLTLALSPYDTGVERDIDIGAKVARNFAKERQDKSANVFEALAEHIKRQKTANSKTIIACWSNGTRERMASVLAEYVEGEIIKAESWQAAVKVKPGDCALITLPLEAGFQSGDTELISEQDILGERLRRKAKKGKASDILKDSSSLTPGDLVVHSDHGIGRFEGLKTIDVSGAPHDCVHLSYDGGDRLFLPIENIELLSKYGSDGSDVKLDRLGGAGWQSRKSKLKQRVRDIAEKLIAIAASRALQTGDILEANQTDYQEFCASFPYEETDDQMNAIDAVISDMSSGRPMDRLICGDVGFGKTEVALRAAYIAAMSGKQVAVIVPTTLLCRQHYAQFIQRFKNTPLRVEQASRLISQSKLSEVKQGLSNGEIDIVIGTHVLLGSKIEMRDLGLIIIDEEQKFGVSHKERLKTMRARAHVLTLTATPIPRTLQMAFTGVRELSLIATPPIDRLAVRTFISPFDPLIIRESLLRELYRGGQSFYVAPRISDLDDIASFLKEHVPEVTFAIAHGQMEPAKLDETMTAFYDGKYNVLLSTSIVESGLDIPTANTLIIHKAQLFGMAQLYQLRGRVGRAKQRGYALLTTPQNTQLTPQAEKRLQVLQSLETLGGGFTLASHDLDIRGAGNLLGEEQSGHIKEVGYELYQSMLEEAVTSLKSGDQSVLVEDKWSPTINLGTAVLIPETYVKDLDLRLSLYRRLSMIEESPELADFRAEMIDRFGDLPIEVEHLLKIVEIKSACRIANIESVDSGPRGAVLSFRNNSFPKPEALIDYISKPQNQAKMKADHKLVLIRSWQSEEDRLNGTALLLERLKKLAS